MLTTIVLSICAIVIPANQSAIVDIRTEKITVYVVRKNDKQYHEVSDLYKTLMTECLQEVCAEWRRDPLAFYGWALNNGWYLGCSMYKEEGYQEYSPISCFFV